MTKLKKQVIFVNCNCTREQLSGLAGLCHVDFGVSEFEIEGTKKVSLQSLPIGKSSSTIRTSLSTNLPAEDQSEARSEVTSTSGIDPSLCTFPVGQECIGDGELIRLTALMDNLRTETGAPLWSTPVVMVDGISEAALIKLCAELGQPERTLLYVASGFYYPKCFRTLAIDPVYQSRNKSSPVGCDSEESTRIGTGRAESPTSKSPRDLPPGGERYLPSQRDIDPFEGSSSVNCTQCIYSDPAPHFMVQENGQQSPWQGRGNQVFVSVNSIGIVSEYADGTLLKTDLGLLGLGIEMIAKKMKL